MNANRKMCGNLITRDEARRRRLEMAYTLLLDQVSVIISRSLLNIIITWLSYLPLIDLAILAKLDTCSNVCNCLPMISSLVVAVAGHLITHEHTLKVWLIDGNNWENTPLQNYSLCWLERTWWILTEEWVLESPHLTKFGWVILLS